MVGSRKYAQLAAKLEELQRRSGRTAGELTDELGLSATNWSHWMSGRRRVDERYLLRLADMLGGDYIELRRLAGYWVPEGAEDAPRIDGWARLPTEDRQLVIRLSQRLAAAPVSDEEAEVLAGYRAASEPARSAIREVARTAAAQARGQGGSGSGASNHRGGLG